MTQRSRKPNFHSLAHAPQTLFSPLTKKSGTKVHACLLACLPCVYVCTVVSFGERDKSITLGKCESNYIWYYILINIWIAVSWFRMPTHIQVIFLGKLRFCNEIVQSRGGTRKAICMYVCTLTPSTLNFLLNFIEAFYYIPINLVNKVRWHMEIRGFKNENSVKLYLKTLLLQNKKGVGWSFVHSNFVKACLV